MIRLLNKFKRMISNPPKAQILEHQHSYFGRNIKDNYHWLKDQKVDKRPEIIKYLESENEYCSKVHLEPNKELTDTIYKEIVGRIQEDDSSVPVKRGDFSYYSKTIKDAQYSIYLRKKGQVEQVLLDQNAMTLDYMDLGKIQVSPNHKILCYSIDTDGSEFYNIYFKDLESGEMMSDKIEKTCGDFEWTKDSMAIYYTTLDHIHRSDKVYRHVIATDPAQDFLVYHEKDEQFIVGINKAASGNYIFIRSVSGLSSETWVLDGLESNSVAKLFQKREPKHKYDVEHLGNQFLIITDGGGRYLNNKLCACPLNQTEQEYWKEVLPYNPLKHLIDICPFRDHLVVYECSDALKHIYILNVDKDFQIDASSGRYLDFPQPLYFVEPCSGVQQDYQSKVIRLNYESMITAKEVWEVDMDSFSKNILKKTNVCGGYDPSQYVMERLYAPIQAGTEVEAPFNTPVPDRIPISIIYKKSLYKANGSNPCLLYGYGSYGISIDPQFSYYRFSLIDRGLYML